MNNSEISMTTILKDLKQNYFVKGLKLEFEAEGATYKEAEISKKIADEAELNLIIKIGGCEAIRDLEEIKKLKPDTIVAPMIETPYALEKYNNAITSVYTKEEQNNINFFINIETITGIKEFDNIADSKSFKCIDGVVLGRGDLIMSMGLNKNDVDSEKIFKITNSVSDKLKNFNKKFVVGGGVFPKSVNFFKKLTYLNAFETRKIIFDSRVLTNQNAETGIIKALKFETEWLIFKRKLRGCLNKKDEERLKNLSDFCIQKTNL